MSDFIEIEGETIHWPMCKTPGCGNRMNLTANNGYCWPCQPSGLTFEEVVAEVGGGLPVRTGS
jgi:hypothetical protein